MSEDVTKENTAPEGQTVETEKLTTEQLQELNSKLYTEVKGLRTESKERRLKLEKFEKDQKEKEDADLSELEKTKKQLATATTDLANIKTSIARKELEGQFIQAVTSAGLPPKIANVAIPTDLSEDNMKEVVKDAIKEFKEFIPNDEKPTTKVPASLFSSVQPQPNAAKKKLTGNPDAVMDEFQSHINKQK